MKIKKLSLLGFVLALIISFTGCKNTATMEKANEAYDLYQFTNAISMYKKVVKKEKNPRRKREANFKIAECYRKMNSYQKAEQFYQKAIKAKYPDPIAIYWYADMMRRQEKFEDAIIQFKNYIKENPADPKGQEGVESCERAIQWKKENTRYVVENFKILNSKYNDFSPVYYKNFAMIFSSDREESVGKDLYSWTGLRHVDLWISTPQKGNRKNIKLEKPVTLDAEGTVNTRYNDGTACFDKKMNTMYYTQCNGYKGKEPNCRIFKVSKKGEVWDEPELLQFCNDSAANYGHPSLSPDGKKLYFSSNMKGGYGQHDIWVSTLVSKGKVWGDPVNLGPIINTAGEEMYPFIYTDNKTLYFSSDGHKGIGGLDVYFSVKSDTGNWSEPVNMKSPINSGSDDFSIIVEAGGTKTKGYKGYLASDRPGSRGDDIYNFYMTPLKFNLSGTVYNDKTKEVVPNATVFLKYLDTTLSVKSDRSGFYKFKLDPDVGYDVWAIKDQFFDSKEDTVSTIGLEFSQDFKRDLYLFPFLDTTFELEGIYYDLDKWNLRPESVKVLDSLYNILIKHPYIVIEIGSHTDCRASYAYNDTLSKKRAQSVVDYLIYKGIPMDRMEPHGYGERDLAIKKCACENNEGEGMNCTEEEHQANRRTTFKVLRSDYVYGANQEPPKQDKPNQNKNINKPQIPKQNQ